MGDTLQPLPVQGTFSLMEQERRHLAQELHDELGQWLAVIQAETEFLVRNAQAKGDERGLASAQAIGNGAREISAVIRRVVGNLRPPLLDVLGLADSLDELVSRWRQRPPGIPCQLAMSGRLDDLGEDLNICLYRITQEALTNVAKHAQAGQVRVTLERQDQEVSLCIENDGRPLAPDDAHRGQGLLGMGERAAALGGVFQALPREEGGTLIRVRLPLPPDAPP